jgi:hypothetical protein
MLTRGLARVGIIALVDEATGYQDQRAKTALRDIFDAFLRKELAAWVQRFPEEFYREIFRLRGWGWKGMKVNRPQVVAYYTSGLGVPWAYWLRSVLYAKHEQHQRMDERPAMQPHPMTPVMGRRTCPMTMPGQTQTSS